MKRWTEAEILALPENGGFDAVTDQATGHTESVRRPVQFLVNDGEVVFYRLRDGSRWMVGRGMNGQHYRERRS